MDEWMNAGKKNYIKEQKKNTHKCFSFASHKQVQIFVLFRGIFDFFAFILNARLEWTKKKKR